MTATAGMPAAPTRAAPSTPCPRRDRGWYSVAFYRSGKVIRWNAYRQGLTYREGKLAAACTRAAVR